MIYQSLAVYLNTQNHRLPLDTALGILEQIATLLDDAHAHGLVHLALTPETVQITTKGKVVITDFCPPGQVITHTAGKGHRITPYTPPELVRGAQPVDHRADIYSLGAIAYTLLLGQPPFAAADSEQLGQAILEQPPAAPEAIQPEVAQSIAFVLKAGLVKDPALRYASASDFVNALFQGRLWVPRVIVHRRQKRPALFVALILTSLLALLFFLRNELLQGLLSGQPSLSASVAPPATNMVSNTPSILPTATGRPATATAQIQSETAALQLITTTATTLGAVTQMVSPLPMTIPVTISVNGPQNRGAEVTPAPPTVTITPSPTITITPSLVITTTSSLTITTAVTPALAGNQSPAEVQEFDFYLPLIARNPTLTTLVIEDANLRSGPDTRYPIVGGVRTATPVVLVACSPQCTWYQLANGGWIAAFLVADIAETRQILPVMVE